MAHMTAAPSWTILVPTLGERRPLFERLLRGLLPQTEPYGGRVQVVAYWNNGSPPLPEIRQRMVEAVTTDYLSFIDDDDEVPEYFVAEVMTALDQRPDYVGWKVRYFANGEDRGLVDHSLRHGGWREERYPYALLRDISHINPMRTDVAKMGNFRSVKAGHIEDRPWVAQIRRTGRLRTEVYVPREMYLYRWSDAGSRWRQPRQIKATTFEAPGFPTPNLTFFPGSVPAEYRAPAAGRPLAVIVPTRGRPENVARLLLAWDATEAWDHADLFLAVDQDDPKIQEYRAVAMRRTVREQLPAPFLVEYVTWLPMVEKLNRTALGLAADRRHFALGFAGDDHLPQTVGWAGDYLAALRDLGTGMVYGDDGYQGAKLSTEWAVTSDAVRALGRMVPARVEHLYCDNAILELFTAAGQVLHLPGVRIEHMHPVARKAPTDAQYDRVNSGRQYRRDRSAFETWKRQEKASQVRILRSLATPDEPAADPAPAPRREGKMMTFTVPRWLLKMVGATPNEIGLTLADLAAQVPEGQAIVELGVYRAKTAMLMAWGARHGGKAHVYGIDAWDLEGNPYDPPFTDVGTKNWARYNVKAKGFADHVTLIQDFSQNVAETWDNGLVGLLFVDGDHSYEGARRDITGWARHLADGAVIAVDDYGHPDWPGVKEAVDALVEENFLAPVEVFHERLAVTRLGPGPAAITSEGVNPEPVKVTEEGSANTFGTPVEVVTLPEPTEEPAPRESERTVVQDGELEDVAGGTSIEDLNTTQLRALAKAREITLGTRKDKRAEMLDALRKGE
jgi:predicted O-methyltransferase YrrM